MASLIAFGRTINLAILVLASIYHGLNQFTNSTAVGSSNACFPIHYVYGWLSHYFRTHFPNPDDTSEPLMTKFLGEGKAKYFKDHQA